MRKYAAFWASLGLAAACGLPGCQVFTAGEEVGEPDPGQVRAQAAPKPHDHNHPHQPKAKAEAPAEAAETATASHILIRYAGSMRAPAEITRTQEEARRLAEEVLKKARQPGANFEDLANQYTEDPSGKGRGGRLGTFGRGRMVPTFDQATFALAPGEVSDLVETPFGYHIIHREK